MPDNTVSLGHSVMQSFTSIGPMLDLIAVFPLIAVFAGNALPYAVIISFLISFTTINTTYQLSRRFSTNGGYYSYIGKVLGKFPGLFIALNYLAYSLIVLLAIASFGGYFISAAMNDFSDASSTALPLVFSLIFISIVFGIVLLGLRKSLRFTLIAGTAEALFILVISFMMFFMPISHSAAVFAPFVPDGSFFTGVIFGILAFSGSGSSIFLSEDSREPKRTPATGLALSFLISGLIMIISSFAVVSFLGSGLTAYVTDPAALLLSVQHKFGFVILLPAVAFLVLSAMNLSVSYMNALLRSMRKMFSDHIFRGSAPKKGGNMLLVIMVVVLLATGILAMVYGSYASFVYMSSLAGLFFITVHSFANAALIKLKGSIIFAMILPIVSLIFLVTVFIISVGGFLSEFPSIVYMYSLILLFIALTLFQARASKQFYNAIEFNVG
ncbi:MAG: APC family permease [Thermoplasmataceae archaeon]